MVPVILVLLLFASHVQAATYYVATTGSNSNDGLTVDTPWLTVKKAVDTMVAGDTTYVRAGTYTETAEVRFTRPGTSSAPIKLAAYQGEAPTIGFSDPLNGNHRVSIWHASGQSTAIGWITIEGLTFTNCAVGVRLYGAHDIVIRNNKFHDNTFHGILGNGTRILIERNIFSHNGQFERCAAGEISCNKEHGIYMNGSDVTIRNNVIYDNLAYGIQLNGSSTAVYDPTLHPGPEFANSFRWIISDNTIAYNKYRSGLAIWGGLADNARVENNIFYENAVSSSSPNGIDFVSATASTGILIKNNHFYASGGGGTSGLGSGQPADIVNSGNIINVSAPAFVTGGSGTLPGSPDFRLTASAPVNICLPSEFLNNSTCVVGAFKTVANPTASIHGNTMVWTFPMSTAVPIQIPSATGFSIGCTGTNCPGSPTVGSALQKPSTDSQVEVVVNGIAGNACVNTNQNWTGTYSSATGSWTGHDNIGPYPGLHQKIFSFTSIAVTNLCDGTSTGGGVGTPLITYKFDEGTGTTATNTGSSGSADNGTLANGAGWTTGKTGSAVNVTGGTQQVQVPYTPGDPTTNSQTWVLAVNVPAGSESATRYDIGTQIGAGQRFYLGAVGGTWRVATQSTTITSAGASNLTVSPGWQQLCLTANAATDTVTLHKDGVAGTGGATRVVTSFTPTGEILIGLTGTGFPAALTPGAYDDFHLYQSVEDCAALHDDWNAPAASVGTFGMPSYRFQAVYLPELGGSPTNITTAINQAKDVVAGGAVAVLLEVHCQNVADCEQDSFRLEARQNGTGSYLQVPDTENDTHIYMWGQDSNSLLNGGATTSRLSAGSCAVTNGATVLVSAQVPVVDLPQDGCVVLRYVVRLGTTASGYYDIQLRQQNGTAFTGTVNPARINVIPMQAGVR